MTITGHTPPPRRLWLITLPSAASIIFLVCALAAQQQKFVAIFCGLFACSIVAVILVLAHHVFLHDLTNQSKTLHTHLDRTTEALHAVNATIADLAGRSHLDDQTRQRLDHLDDVTGRMRRILAAHLTDEPAHDATTPNHTHHTN
ncbi:hypothetical protein LO763_22275 [Glycomyces sp. A-F 0318]|uniref:hypothetical protein n=1 Tax=Glycomyces amatae TaxID=2881355 RepID=UPI001E5DD359|nr:hypothetical protein [Glycomyces amatae]MCD0446345.1 hypothetical protein [Glycomyces amatae]